MKSLIDKIIKKIFVGDNILIFETDKGDISFSAEGDCCSESYFSDINRVKNLLGGKVNSVKEVDLPETEIPPHETRQEIDAVYGFHINTDKGTGIIIMRNSSNGYYGGWIERIYQKIDKLKMIKVKKDYNSKDYFET